MEDRRPSKQGGTNNGNRFERLYNSSKLSRTRREEESKKREMEKLLKEKM
jgi:hypothetical protein